MKNKKINRLFIAVTAIIAISSIIWSNNSNAALSKNGLPDLTIENLQTNTTSPDNGESATVSFDIVNSGIGNAQWTPDEKLYDIYFGDGVETERSTTCFVNGNPCGEKYVLTSGARMTVISVVTYPSVGIKKITTIADPNNAIFESSENNNSKSIVFIGKKTAIGIVALIISLLILILIIAFWIRKKWKKEVAIVGILVVLLFDAVFVWLINQQSFVQTPLHPVLTDQQKAEQVADQVNAKKIATQSFGSGEYGYEFKFPMNWSAESQPLGDDSLENISATSEDGQEKFNVKVLINSPKEDIYNGQKSDVTIDGVTYTAYLLPDEKKLNIPVHINGRWYVVSGNSNMKLLSPQFLEILATLEFAK